MAPVGVLYRAMMPLSFLVYGYIPSICAPPTSNAHLSTTTTNDFAGSNRAHSLGMSAAEGSSSSMFAEYFANREDTMPLIVSCMSTPSVEPPASSPLEDHRTRYFARRNADHRRQYLASRNVPGRPTVSSPAVPVPSANTPPPGRMFAEYLTRRDRTNQQSCPSVPTPSIVTTTPAYTTDLSPSGGMFEDTFAEDKSSMEQQEAPTVAPAATPVQPTSMVTLAGVADTIAIVGSTKLVAQRRFLGMYRQREELVNGRVSYVKEHNDKLMVWWDPGEAVGAWMVGESKDVGGACGYLCARGNAPQPGFIGRGEWQVVDVAGWSDAPDIQVLHNLRPGPSPKLVVASMAHEPAAAYNNAPMGRSDCDLCPQCEAVVERQQRTHTVDFEKVKVAQPRLRCR